MTEVYNQFLELLGTGDGAAIEHFLEQHLKELPEELQDKIIFAMFEDAVTKEATAEEALAQMKQDGLDLIKKLQKAKDTFEEAQKVQELKSSLE